MTCPTSELNINTVMETKQTQINHLIKTLAEQLRHMESIEEGLGQSLLLSMACKAASKTVAQLKKLGIDHDDAFDKAEALNEAMTA